MRMALGLALLVGFAAPAQAQEAEQSSGTAEIFRRFADRVVKIEVVETGSGAKATVGSGFLVTAAGHLVTNYHVVSQFVRRPERYRVQWYDAAGRVRPGRVIGVDVVRDLAVVSTDVATDRFFTSLGYGCCRLHWHNAMRPLRHALKVSEGGDEDAKLYLWKF